VRAYREQLFAAGVHNCYGRLARIAAPTLVVHGRHDRMVPAGNGELLAERIPGARLRMLEESGHLYPTEEPDVDEEIAAFLAGQGEEER
jgi:pimeloyl-ACP methyl ester carboxylesterase